MTMRPRLPLTALLVLIVACGGSGARPVQAVTFDGNSCVMEGPETVTPGHASFVVTNLSEWESIPLYVVRLAGDHSLHDLADLQAERSGPPAYFSTPEWVPYALRSFAPASIELEGDQRHYGYTLGPGEHGIWLGKSRPAALWLCGALQVTAG